MCAYQKNYEQYVKNGTQIEDTEIKNRFEIRMKNERAYYAVVDLLTYRDAERTAFSIINHYVRFVDREDDKPKSQCKLAEKWLQKTAVDSELQVNENDTQIHIKGREFALYHRQTYCILYRDEIRREGILEPSDGIKYLESSNR